MPSVTTVLDIMSDKKSSLSEWRNRVGDIEADRVMKEATDIGTMVHLSLENHLNGIDEDIFSDNSLGNMANRMSKKLIDDLYNKLQKSAESQIKELLPDLKNGSFIKI